MRVCPKCKSPIDDDASACASCGQEIEVNLSETLDADAFLGEQASSPQPNQAASDTPGTGDADVGGTLEAPDASELPPLTPDVEHASEAAPELGITIDIESSAGDASGDDQDFSISADDQTSSGTVQYNDDDLDAAKSGRANSGTAGRLKRLWMGAAGSSASPMHTLKGTDALATDSVFDRVASRVLIAHTDIKVKEISGTSTKSQPDRQARVEECIEEACRGANSEAADYDLTGFLGQGGMGVVLQARQRAIGRDVALKMVQPSKGDSAANTLAQQKKFFYEAQITGKLDHPNIVPIYELGVSNDILFYSMKMIVGTEWKDVIETKSRDENLDILMKILDAMAFAHEKGVIHRDLKPENVMLGPFGEVLVTDWGCAVDLTRNEKFTGAGSPPWMAPEMASHEMDRIGPKSDIYLLGAMLYQIIAKYPPHPGRSVWECIQAAAKNVILPLEVDDPLLDIALHAMETEPDDRYATVAEMQEAIREYRRHAESITLTERSDALLQQAIESKDYERFSRTVFGYRDAIELWPQNKAAISGLQKARMAQGQCAFDKGDYDLCLQVLDQSVPAEAKLRDEASRAQKLAEERESRFKTLRKVLAAVILFAIVGLSGLSAYAVRQQGLAEKSRDEAVESAKAETKAKADAILAAKTAEDERKKAVDAGELAESERKKAVAETKRAVKAEGDALAAKTAAETAEGVAKEATAKAIEEEKKAVAQKVIADEQRLLAEQRTLDVELGSYQSKLSLAMNQVKQLNVGSARQGLDELSKESTFETLSRREGGQPKFDNWALKRVKLLSNTDLLQTPLGDPATAVTFATAANRGVAATCAQADRSGPGQLHVVHLEGNRLVVEQSIATDAGVDSVAISADGMQVAFALSPQVGISESKIYTLDLSSGQAQPKQVAERSSLEIQGIAISGERLVGGINGGMHVWLRQKDKWVYQQTARVKGRLRSLQMVGDSIAIVLAERDGETNVYRVNLDGEGERASVAFDIPAASEMFGKQISALAYSNGKVILGTDSGQLFSSTYSIDSPSIGPEFREIEPRKHESAVRSIHAHSDGTLLTIASEPVAHVWRTSAKESGWKYATFLAGTTSNLADAAFMGDSALVFAVDEAGIPIVWDVQRQQQRQQLRRLASDGSELNYSSPVKQVVTANDNVRAVSIHADGTIDSWELQTGKTIGASEVPFEFVGHSPGATFEDMAIDHRAGILITSAMLPSETSAQVFKKGERLWEYCKWDLNRQVMLERWTRPEVAPQKVSLLDAGELVLYASNENTTVAEAREQGNVQFESNDFSSFFAVENPAFGNLIMLVKNSGAVRVFDRENKASFDASPNKLDYDDAANAALLSSDDVPFAGRWSPAGDRFYMIWRSGRITEFAWENSKLSLRRDLRENVLVDLGIQFDAGQGNDALIQLQDREQLDVRVKSAGKYNLLYYAVRFPGVEGRTRLVRVVFPLGEGTPAAAKAEEEIGRFHLVLDDDASPVVDQVQLAQLPIDAFDVAAVRNYGNTSYFATPGGVVYTLTGNGDASVLGRPELLSGTGNASANRIVTLHEGGVMWRGDEQDGEWSWSALATAPAGSQSVVMSPDGEQLLITTVSPTGATEIVAADANTGEIVQSLRDALYGAFDSSGEIAIADSDGTLLLRSAAGDRVIGKLQAEWEVQSMHFFAEAWANGEPPKQWLVAHTVNTSSMTREGRLEFFSLDPNIENKGNLSTPIARGIQVLACSPSEGIFVTGGSGIVSVHFAAPTLGELDKVLYNLAGHAGAEIECLAFSHDGKTLVSADDKNRQFSWLSEDTMHGIVVQPPSARGSIQ